MQTSVLGAIDDRSLRAYVVWIPILQDDSPAAAVEARVLVSDPRATHYWDADGRLPKLFHSVLQLPAEWPAWDVYLLYPPGVTWRDEAPPPSYWEHQLGTLPNAPFLSGERFAARVRSMLEQA